MPRSITRRMLISNLLVLATFLGLTGAALDRAFRTSSEAALRERLEAHVYTLLAAAEADAQGLMRLPDALSAPALNTPDSGLYAEVRGENARYRWHSGSLIGSQRQLLTEPLPGPGELHFRRQPTWAVFEFGVEWEDDAGNAIPYALGVASDTRGLQAEQSAFRSTLWRWLGGLAVLLVIVQTLLARWGLSPLREMSDAVRRIEDGESASLDGPVAEELKGLSDNLNILIQQSRNRQERVRNSLADLAHSMKTPLAVLRGAAGPGADPALRQLLDEQTERIDQIVSYQRQRAAVAGSSNAMRRVALAPVLRRLTASLDKVNAERQLACTLDVPDALRLRADEGDLFELFGNLLENAYKHAATRITVIAEHSDDQVSVSIDDDGPGIPKQDVERLLRRGERADQQHPGDGIGLAVVAQIVAQYDGLLSIDRVEPTGARIVVTLPH